ncbi:hypothetical protein [Salmonirosea aquatica]|uniref:Lipocalin-like domain-containing protein n=1 Tax=Salmonirosea aquatica TaxID=2654236 RepID=A0A7C9BEC4_9BACT|nr:hypothetical protein [Cytophagaceae bacterium SJW1-29]
MKRTITYLFLLIPFLFLSCKSEQSKPLPIEGTWELISATTIEGDTTFSTFDSTRNMIKILNGTHFAFLNHALNAKDSTAAPFSAGGGTFTLVDSTYTEHLDYFVDPAWENHTFEFVVKIENDTLVQKGIEKLEELGIDRVIVEKYRRIKANP